jgi:DNA-binding transcriptional LysR family regulator
MPLTSTDLHVFDAVVTAGSFGRAATALQLSQPAVSERIARMEAVLQVELFVRSPRGVIPTAAGELLVPFAKRQATLLDDAVDAARTTARIRRLVVAVHSTFTADIAPAVLDGLGGLERRIEFREAHSEQIVPLVAEGSADVGFVVPSTLPRGLIGHRLPDDPIVAVVAPTHPLAPAAGRARVRFDDLAGHLVAIASWGAGAATLHDLLAARRDAPQLRRVVPDPRTALLLAGRHGHVAFVARSAARHEVLDGGLVELRIDEMPDWRLEVDVIHRVGTSDEAVLRIVPRVLRPDRPAGAARVRPEVIG